MRLDLHMWVEPRDRLAGALGLRRADIGGREDHLPLQVRQRHFVVVDHPERADARGGEVQKHRRAEPAGADHQNARGLELGLARAADLAQHDVARITFQFFCFQHPVNLWLYTGFGQGFDALRGCFDGLRCRALK